MTEQQSPETLTADDAQEILARIERQDRERRERRDQIDRAWQSPEAAAVMRFVRDDDNLPGWDLRELASKAGGILELTAMVDADGNPDPARLVPFIDGIFEETARTNLKGGMTMTRRPKNRPYRPPMPVPAVRYDTDGLTAQDAKRMLDQAEQQPSVSLHGRR